MIVNPFARERLLPAGVMAFMLVTFLALSFHFDARWWAAHHAVAAGAARISTSAPASAPAAPLRVHRAAELPARKNLSVPGPVRWEIVNSKEWNGVEATMPEPRPAAHSVAVERNPKRPFRTLGKEETRQVFRELREAETNARNQALAVDPAYGPRFGDVLQRNLTEYRRAIADAHALSAEQISALYREMVEGPSVQRGAPPHLANILP